jgi:hypothetical protein
MPINTMLNLARNFARRQVPAEAHEAGQAKPAGHCASHLCGNAERLRRRIGNVDRLDAPAIRQPQQELRGAIDGHLFRVELGFLD